VAKVQPISFQHRRVEAPTVLRDLQGWLCWRYEPHPEGGKPIKVPYYADGGRRYGANGNPTDRAKLVKFAAARDAAAKRNMDGVGLALMPEFGITATDFDHCVNADGNVPHEIEQIAARTYTEYSPSGAGVRAFSVGRYGNRKSPTTPGQYGFETFSDSGFVTFTGNVLPICELLGAEDTVADDPTVHAIIRNLCDTRFAPRPVELEDDFTAGHAPRLGLTHPVMERILGHISPDIGRDEWIRVGMALHHECEGDDTGFDLWDTWSADGATYPGTDGLRAQWDSFDRRAGRGRKQTTMASVILMAKRNGYVHKRPDSASSPEEVMARAEVIAAAPRAERGRFGPIPIYDLSLQPPGDWLIKGVLPDADLVVLFGASGSGKTFVALDMAFCVAQGLPWRGNRAKQGKVVIIAAEGAGGLSKRAKAYAQHHGIDLRDVDIQIITAAPNFLHEEDIAEVLAEIKALGEVTIVVVDTLAQVTPGANENGAEDMGRALANLRLIREMAGATVMAVHHAGKDASKGSRGWSGIKAAADAQIEVIRHEDGQREIHLEKMKDGEDGLRFGFRLEIIELGVDADGDRITSCVAVEADLPVAKTEDRPSKGIVRYGTNERHVLEVIESEYAAVESASETLFVARCAELLPKPDAGKRDQRLFLMRRAVQSLVKRKDGPIALEHGRVIFCT
jgi:KaiC/GvpD/RAD55 family RecA-like ATPase